MLVFLLFYTLVWPLTVLLHEIGHGLEIVISSKSHAHILGNITTQLLWEDTLTDVFELKELTINNGTPLSGIRLFM